MPRTVVAFDMFGTLADPASYAEGLRTFVPAPEQLAAAWRHHQLEISWLLSLAERYESWPAVTAYALDTALAESGLELTPDQRDTALGRAGSPALFEDVAECLTRMRAEYEPAVFSNGDREGLTGIVADNGIAEQFTTIVSSEEVGVYKPAPATYRHLAGRLDHPIEQVWLVSGNPFDCAGAALAGMRVAKLERTPALRYPFAPAPDVLLTSLAELPGALGTCR